MATFRKSNVPPLRHTSLPTKGPKSVTSNYRVMGTKSNCCDEVNFGRDVNSGRGNSPSSWTLPNTSGEFVDAFLTLDGTAGNTSTSIMEPTEYELHCKSSIDGWKELRSSIRTVVTESAAIHVGQICCSCPELATLRCQRCGPMTFFCSQCFISAHSAVNVFHVAEKWQDGCFVPVFRTLHMDVRKQCKYDALCEEKGEAVIVVVDEYGLHHEVEFVYCNCESFLLSLIRARLWPATPKQPKLAFSFDLLNLFESLMLECQVSLKDFCQALKYYCPFTMPGMREIYPVLIDSFEEYRYLRHDLQHMKYLCENLDEGNKCPACPISLLTSAQAGVERRKVITMDGIFGLPRKKAAGASFRSPLYNNIFFCDDQSELDHFVNDISKKKSGNIEQDCNDFVAGSMLRSASRYKALDETGIFGCCCRHEFPQQFVNMKHGERLSYPLWMLDKISTDGSDSDIFIMYDVACSLSKYLQNIGRDDILKKMSLCLPTFHSYGHTVSCQLMFGPRRCEGIGLSDGENVERLWSFLRRFGKMTKEMRPSHRVDVLSSALEYYGLKTKKKLASLILLRWDKANKCKALSEESMKELYPAFFNDNVAQGQIQKWLEEEKLSLQQTDNHKSEFAQWKLEYVQELHHFYCLRDQLISGIPVDDIGKEYSELNNHLEDIERKNSVLCRWSRNDRDYQECLQNFTCKKREVVLISLMKIRQKREFLLNLKKKYADGQKIAKKVSRQISKETTSFKKLLNEYNSVCCTSVAFDHLSVAEALSSGVIEGRLQGLGSLYNYVATGSKRAIMDAYLMLCRSKEELQMLEQEAKNLVCYYSQREIIVSAKVKVLSSLQDDFSRGATAMLKSWLYSNKMFIDESKKTCLCIQNYSSKGLVEFSDSDISDDETYDDYQV